MPHGPANARWIFSDLLSFLLSMTELKPLLNSSAIQRALARIAHEIAEKNEDSKSLIVVGIQRGGIHLAKRLARLLESIWGHAVPVGELDVSMHRDDLDQRITPDVHPTSIPGDVTGKAVVLVDDVLFRGRTTRAAMDAINDFGRPRSIQLAVLVDRGHRELPVKADFVGKYIPTGLEERIDIRLQETGGDETVYLQKI
jgi:pyrimidine operon attenuation protein / uracil phosphoribosyltransferase